ncbi:MAG: GyrI-like domain-containing protein [Candidatus Hermodarchaeota archaeon]
MKDIIVRIVKLEPMRVAYYCAFSKTPEDDASKVMRTWGQPKGFFDNPAKHFHFGYNNPPPSAAGEAYGYECLITVGSDVKSEGEVKIKEIPGGLYAVVRCPGPPEKSIPATWHYLFNEWLKTNGKFELDEDNEPGLEEIITPLEPSQEKWIFDLYLPIKKRD